MLVMNTPFLAVALGLTVLVAACSSDSDSTAVQQPVDTPTPTSSPTVVSTPTPVPPIVDTLDLSWEIETVDSGAKPALALDSDGIPHVAYMEEAQEGFVKSAIRQNGAWDITTVAEGYFYGPLDVTVGNDDRVHVAYHDHQAATFDPDLGEAVHAVSDGGAYVLTVAEDDGHDGWDNRITTDAAGRPHMVGIDPVEFGGQGVEY
ncbi:MAG: hypothetical protein V3S98_04735, partial [Dehalococcoidia bacterium]